MKLVLCGDCFDVFKLDRRMRYCKCKNVKGRYLKDNLHAEVSGRAISIALGNGSVVEAIGKMQSYRSETDDKANRSDYIRECRIDYAWVRPNEGPGNPHCKVIT
jgi:hypothetical protein